MPVTISDVARIANVSKATVSLVLNDKPGISDKTRQRILKIVSDLNYRPSELARSLSRRRSRSIGIVIKEIDNPFFTKIMKGVYDTCVHHGYTVLLGSSELSPEREMQSIETLVNQRVEGLILAPLRGKDVDFSYLADLSRDRFPLVTLGQIENFPTSIVDVKNKAGALEAVRFLISLGHRRIVYFSGPSHSSHSQDRAEGYRQAFLESQLSYRPEDMVEVGSYIENGYNAGIRIFSDRNDFPTAVFCYNDLVAMGLINALTELTYSVPEEVSVLGFDNIQYAAHFKVPLTTVHVPTYKMGKAAAEIVISRINDPEKPRLERRLFDAELIHRQSVSVKNPQKR